MKGRAHLAIGLVAAGGAAWGLQRGGVDVAPAVAAAGFAAAAAGSLAPDIDHRDSLVSWRIPATIFAAGAAMLVASLAPGWLPAVWRHPVAPLMEAIPLEPAGLLLMGMAVLPARMACSPGRGRSRCAMAVAAGGVTGARAGPPGRTDRRSAAAARVATVAAPALVLRADAYVRRNASTTSMNSLGRSSCAMWPHSAMVAS